MPVTKRSAALRRLCLLAAGLIVSVTSAFADDLREIRERGVLRHLGVPYANFVTGSGDGLDVEIVQLFARHLGVRYEYVPTTWGDVIGDLTGKQIRYKPTLYGIEGKGSSSSASRAAPTSTTSSRPCSSAKAT